MSAVEPGGRQPDPRRDRRYGGRRQRTRRAAHRRRSGGRRFDGIREGHGSAPYQGNVVVLVDRHTGSSGEKAAIELQRALGATLIGEPTAGAMQYTEGVPFALPRTGLICTVPTKRADYGADVEGIGWPVDVPLDPIDQPAAAAISAVDR